MQVLITCGLVFILGFWSGTMMVATSLILTERPALVVPKDRCSWRDTGQLFPSYQRYLARAE